MVQEKESAVSIKEGHCEFHSEMGNLSLRDPILEREVNIMAFPRLGLCSLSHRVISQFTKCSTWSVSDQRYRTVLTVWEVLIKKTISQAMLPSILKWGIYKTVGLPNELKWLSPSAAPLLSHIGNPSCWNEASRRTRFSKIYAIWPGSRKQGPSIKKGDSEPVATSISSSSKEPTPHAHMRQALQGDLIGLEIEKWAAAASPRSLLFSRVCLF